MNVNPATGRGERPSEMGRERFVERFGSVFEHSPWIAEAAFDAGLGAAGDTAGGLHQAMCAAFRTAGPEHRLAVLRAHPDLAGKLAAARRLTAELTAEQASAGLDALTDDERARFTRLNAEYVEKFGFPFIIAVRGLGKEQILAAFERRLENSRDAEFESACAQVERIARLRLEEMLPAGQGVPARRRTYYAPHGGHPPQTDIMTDRAVFTEAYAVIPKGVMRDIVTSALPFWEKTRAWIIARPLSGFAETFSQYIMEVLPGGGSERPEPDPEAEAVLFVVEGELTLTLAGSTHTMAPGGYAFVPPAARWTVTNRGQEPARFHWIRKAYEAVDGIDPPAAFVVNEADIAPTPMPGTEGRWATTRFVDPADMRHDMHVTIVTFGPGGSIPFAETHVMEHGLYVLEGKGVYRLNNDWVEVEAGDFMWLRAFCPQACYAGGPGPFRYLLYKDVNRHMKLTAGPRGR